MTIKPDPKPKAKSTGKDDKKRRVTPENQTSKLKVAQP